jgi:hypothetical protein
MTHENSRNDARAYLLVNLKRESVQQNSETFRQCPLSFSTLLDFTNHLAETILPMSSEVILASSTESPITYAFLVH